MGTKKNLFMTAEPRTGKSTALHKVLQALGVHRCGGFLTPEVREAGERIGFDCVTLEGERIRFADVKFKTFPRVSRYGLDLESFNKVIIPAVRLALQQKEILVIDELGPMEFGSDEFQELLAEILASPKPLLGTIFLKPHPAIDAIKRRLDVELYQLTIDNRDAAPTEILQQVQDWLK